MSCWDNYCSDGNDNWEEVGPTVRPIGSQLTGIGAAPFEPPMYVPQQRGWLVKVDEFGCLVPDCQLVSTDELPATEPPFQILTYPNPTTDRLNVFLKTAPGAGSHTGELLDATGRSVRQFGGTAAEVTYVLDTQELPAGVYFLHVVVDGRWVRSERVVVQ